MIATVLATLAWALALTLCVPGLHGRPRRALAVLAVFAALLHLPLGGGALAALRGAFADPALTTLVVLAALLQARACPAATRRFPLRERHLVAALAAGVGVLFYPPALGFGPVDPYLWGYGSAVLPLCAGALALLAWAGECRVLAAAIAAALAGWRAQVLETPNLWDYLIDPLLALGGLLALFSIVANSAYRAMRRPASARSAENAADAR